MRSILRTRNALVLSYFFLATFMVVTSSFAVAQSLGITQITGVVLDAQSRPVGDAQVRLFGPASKTTSTAVDGSFTFVNLPAGTFRLDISKAGFNLAAQDDIVTSAGSTTNLHFTLQAASLTSLTVIGNVSVNAHGANAINTTPASIVDVPGSTFTDQGQIQVNQVLNEEPGVTITSNVFNYGGTAANPIAGGIPSVRGGLPYETASLIDGHMIALGCTGSFSPNFLSPYMLENVEIVKGPGATSPSINYAINGTINYRTLEPTLKPQESADFGMDQYGGNVANFRATGTLPGGRLSYALDYETQGTQGFDRGLDPPQMLWNFGPASLNGTPINAQGGFGAGGGSPLVLSSLYISGSTLICCPNIPQYFNQRNELGKLRYAFTPSTTLTVTWLGGQSTGVTTDGCEPTPAGSSFFTPPSGYTGSIPAGPIVGFWNQTWPDALQIQGSNLFEAEFHTPLGKTATLLLRQFSSSIRTFGGGPGDSGPTAAGTLSATGALYGGIYYGTSNTTTPTIFNGQIGTLTESGSAAYGETRIYNNLNGYTAEIDDQAGDDLLSLSYDEEKTSTYGTYNSISTGPQVSVPGGSSQTFQSVMGRVQFELGQRVNGTLSDNFGSYTDVYTQNAGQTFQSATHTYQAPRLSLTWRPNANQSIRASVGTSIAPPYINLLNNNLIVSAASGVPPLYYYESGNTGDVLPETAFGVDVGMDTRLRSPFTVFSVDAYQTLLRDQFLNSTTQQGTYTCTNPSSIRYGYTAPLYVTTTANLGHSEYEGIEVALHRDPPTGWGYRIQGSLQRAFAYDLPAGFYDTVGCTNCTNLAILPNINYQASYYVANAMSSTRIPYSTGYGEINYHGRNGASFLAGITYYGPNNGFDEPAFEVVTASYTQPLTRRSSLQLSIYNLTNTYPSFLGTNPLTTSSTPISTPLINGYLGLAAGANIGPSTARLTLHIDM